jgi:D-proline reductase (dithiol) PrdB
LRKTNRFEAPVAIKRLIHQGIARLTTYWPYLSDKLIASFKPLAFVKSPWTPVTKPLNESKIAVVTTAGLHHREQPAFNMADSYGDPTYRILDAASIETDYTITHDYYDHRDADKDINIVFPITRLKEMAAAGCIGAVAERHISFMGHIDGHHIDTLKIQTAPQVAKILGEGEVDVVLLTPA